MHLTGADDQFSEEEWLEDALDLEEETIEKDDVKVTEEEFESEPESDLSANDSVHSKFSTLTRWLLIYVLSLQTVFRLSDHAFNHLLNFLRVFFNVAGKICPPCAAIAHCIPNSLLITKKLIIKKVSYDRYVVCSKCHHLYDICNCENHCSFQRFPNHSQARMRQKCGTPLTRKVNLPSGKQVRYPFRVYCYVGLKESLRNLFSRPNFYQQIEHWRSRTTEDVVYRDVYDGKVWKQFMHYDGQPFLDNP